jgi:hypothetical protein
MIELKIENKEFVLEIKQSNLKEYSDFYYYGIDDGIIENKNIVIENQIENLKSWKEQILNLRVGDLFLPFDFSDQYLGCLRLSKNNGKYRLCYGFFDGIRAAYPSYCRPFGFTENSGKFIETCSLIEVNHEELLLDIERIISNFSSEINNILSC